MPEFSRALVNQITDECCEEIEDLLTELGVSYTRSNRRLFGCCPIHGGDNPNGWNLYPEGEEVRGIWYCRTRGCHRQWKTTLVGFVHALLSQRTDKKVLWTDAVRYMARFLGYKTSKEVRLPTPEELERRAFNSAARRLNVSPRATVDRTWTPESYRRQLEVPSQYYIDRGYPAELMQRYDVGDSQKSQRSVVPIYDVDHKIIVGMSARTWYKKCPKCSYFHAKEQECPKLIVDQINACKWKNSPGFEAAHFLYNLWFARPHIMKTSTIILVEGPGDVWRLEEAGIKNSVAIFGVDLTEEQLSLIESSWAMNVIVLTDNDEAGQQAAKDIKEKLHRTHRLFFPTLRGDDVGALQTDQVTSDIAPILKQITQFHRQLGV